MVLAAVGVVPRVPVPTLKALVVPVVTVKLELTTIVGVPINVRLLKLKVPVVVGLPVLYKGLWLVSITTLPVEVGSALPPVPVRAVLQFGWVEGPA